MKILFLVPHLSTGGMPQYTYWLIKTILENTDNEVFVIEFRNQARFYNVQKERIRKLIGENLITLGEKNKEEDFNNVIKDINPNVIHLQEIPELWLPESFSKLLYQKSRNYRIIETSHDSGFDPNNKRYFPDEFAYISDFHVEAFKQFNVPYRIVEYPIIKKERPNRGESLFELGLSPHHKHVLNVGLFTSRKNQGEIFEIARKMLDKKILFHFVGNLAPNFAPYWHSIITNAPKNCRLWLERDDVDNFYRCMDLFLFTSKGTNTDRETNPLVLKEALGWDMPVLMYDLPVYNGKYNNDGNVAFLDGNIETSCSKILEQLGL